MNQTSVTYRQDMEFAGLIAEKKFGGLDGALSYFHNVYETPMNHEMMQGDFFLVRKCINLHLEASRFYTEGYFFKRRYAIVLAYKAALHADILKEKIASDAMTADDCYLWVASHVAFITLNLDSIFGSSKVAHSKSEQFQKLAPDVLSWLDFLLEQEYLKNKVPPISEESVWSLYTPSNHFLSSKYPELLSTTVLCQQKIRTEMMLYKLCIVGLHTLPDECVTRDRLFAYAMFHEKSPDISVLKIVAELFQVLSNFKDAKKIEERIVHLESVMSA